MLNVSSFNLSKFTWNLSWNHSFNIMFMAFNSILNKNALGYVWVQSKTGVEYKFYMKLHRHTWEQQKRKHLYTYTLQQRVIHEVQNCLSFSFFYIVLIHSNNVVVACAVMPPSLLLCVWCVFYKINKWINITSVCDPQYNKRT